MASTYQEQLNEINRQQEESKLSRSQIEQQKRQIEQNRLSITQPRKRQAFTERKTRESQRVYLKEELPKAEQSISDYEKQLSTYEGQLSSAKYQVEKAKELERLYDLAEKLALKYKQTGDARILWSASLQFGKNKDVWRYFNDYRRGLNTQRPIETPPGTYGVSTPDGVKLIPIPGEQGYSTKEGYTTQLPKKPEARKISFEELIKQQSLSQEGIEKVRQQLSQQKSKGPVRAVMVDLPVYDESGRLIRTERALVKQDISQGFLNRLQYSKYTSPGYKKFLKSTEELRLIPYGFASLVTRPATPIFEKIFGFGRMEEKKSLPAKTYRGGLAAGKVAALESNPITGIPTTVYFVSKGVEGLSTDPAGFISGLLTGAKEEPFEFAGTVAGAGGVRTAYGTTRTLLQSEKNVARVSSLSRDILREPFVRPRATIIIKDAQGRYLLGIDKNSGNYITFGGGIEKGQSARQALLAELKQETGLSAKDISSYKLRDRLTTARDDYFVYEIKLKPGADKRIVPSSDVSGIKWVSPKKGYTGATPLNPLGQPTKLGFAGRQIRPEDAYLISRTEELIKIDSSLSKLSKESKDKLLLEARNRLGREFGANKLEGITNNQLLRDYLLYKKKLLPTQLYFKSSMGELLLSPTSRYNIPTKQQAKFTQGKITKQTYKTKRLVSKLQINDFLTPNYNTFKLTKRMGKRTYQRSELLTTLTPQRIGADSLSSFLTGKRKVFGEKTVRGETPGIYVSPPTYPGSKKGYAGLVYLFGGSEKGLGLGFRSYKTPQIYTLKAKIGGEIYKKGFTLDQLQQYAKFRTGPVANFYKSMEGKGVVPTPKSFGRELEAVITPGTVFKVSGRKKTFYLAGKKIQQREIKLVRVNKKTANKVSENLKIINNPYSSKGEYNQAVRELKQTTGMDYSAPGKKRIEVSPNLVNNLIKREEQRKEQRRLVERKVNIKETRRERQFESLIIPEGKINIAREGKRPATKEGRIIIPERRLNALITREPKKIITKEPPKEPPRKQPPKNPLLFRRDEQKNRRFKRKFKRGRAGYNTLPTVFELLTFGGAKSKQAKKKISGFEIFRFT
jgi:8-oxo-dGTP pyrophosphatase MutT (NUDIX family)